MYIFRVQVNIVSFIGILMNFATLKKKYKPPQKFAVVPSIVGRIK